MGAKFQVEPNRIFEPQKCDLGTLKDFEIVHPKVRFPHFCARRLTWSLHFFIIIIIIIIIIFIIISNVSEHSSRFTMLVNECSLYAAARLLRLTHHCARLIKDQVTPISHDLQHFFKSRNPLNK